MIRTKSSRGFHKSGGSCKLPVLGSHQLLGFPTISCQKTTNSMCVFVHPHPPNHAFLGEGGFPKCDLHVVVFVGGVDFCFNLKLLN